ncbi:MAG TPA: secretin N-terminal domain-containing protein [Methylotenera sp.]|nr:secretin N-terminal domain-containing protein [Methylotenera sp.]
MKFTKNHHQQKQAYKRSMLFLMVLTQISSCAFAPWEKTAVKGDTPEAKVMEAKKIVKEKPDDTLPRKNLLVTQELATTKLLKQAQQARAKGQYVEADDLYDRVLQFLPDEQGALSGKQDIQRELVQEKKVEKAVALIANNHLEAAREIVRDVLLENPSQAAAIKLQQEINGKLATEKAQPPRLKIASDKPVSLELRDANIKVVFEALSRATGINFILDKDIKPDTKATIFVKKARIEDAIDHVLSSNGLQKKVLSENTVLVFPSTQQKLKDYQDLMIRSFYFTNTSAKQVSTLLKTMLKTKDIFVDERLNMLVMRDTPEVIRIAEKLVAANDLEDPEVMLEIEVLEVSRSRLQELGIDFPNRIAVNSLIPITTVTSATGVVASSTVNTANQLTLEGLLNLNKGRFDVSPNPAVNFRKVTGDVNLLSNPRIRVRNNEKAKILVGDKVPIITTTSTANVGISESVQYVDVGLKLDVEPRVTLNDFVVIKVGLEVSSLGEKTVTRNGATVYTIGTRNANTVLRLKNGETQILAGLILDDERKNASKLPGIGDIPLLGRLFANQEDRKNKTEIVLAITPRVIGNINLPQAEVSEYWSGTETVITDKPQVNLPPTNAPKTPQEQMKEQARLRQLEANPVVTPELPVTEQAVTAPEIPVNNPVSEKPIQQSEPQQPEEQTVPIPMYDSSNPPLAP